MSDPEKFRRTRCAGCGGCSDLSRPLAELIVLIEQKRLVVVAAAELVLLVRQGRHEAARASTPSERPDRTNRGQRLRQFVSSPTRRGPRRQQGTRQRVLPIRNRQRTHPVLFCTRGTAHRSSEADHPVERLDRQQAREAGRRLVDRSRRGFPTMAISCPETSCWEPLTAHLGGIRDDGEFHRKRNSGVAAKSSPARVFACRTVGPSVPWKSSCDSRARSTSPPPALPPSPFGSAR